jgi:resorcinol 4-hydroxylase (FADH2)
MGHALRVPDRPRARRWVASLGRQCLCGDGVADGVVRRRGAARRLGKDVDAIIAGSLIPVGNRVTTVDGGYRLSGRWPFTSGAHHAHWLILGELVEVGGKPEHTYFLVPSRECRIDDDWFVVGMVGTGSATVVLDDVFVPAHRMLMNRDVTAGTAPGTRQNPGSVFRMPLFGFAQLVLAAVAVGVTAGMVEDFTSHSRARLSGSSPVSGADMVYARLSEVAVESRTATLLLLDAARDAMARLRDGQALNEADTVRTLRDSAYALRLAKQAATKILESSGGHALGVPLQRGFGDVHAAGNHGSLSWERVALRYGQVALRA